MGRASILEVEADRLTGAGALSAIRVGGGSVLVSSGTLRI